MADPAMDQLMKAIMRAEKQMGGNHTYRHVFSALREARYAASRVEANSSYESPGRQQAAQTAGKAHIPEAEDARNPSVPDSPAESGTDNGAPASTT